MMHHHGKPVTDEKAFTNLDVTNPIWEFTKDRIGRGAGASIIYGPYTNDFHRPGDYSATFKIRGIGFPRQSDVPGDLNQNVFMLDVLQTEILGAERKHNIVALGYVKVRGLAREGWQEYKLDFSTDGAGIWEYRVFPFFHNGGPEVEMPAILEKFGAAKIYFDTVVIRRARQTVAWSI
jgi:hypothetical protein